MQPVEAGVLLHEAMVAVLKLGGPVLLVALGVGLMMSLIQAVTQINEQALAFIPKVVAIGLTLTLMGPFIANTLTDFARHVFDQIVAAGAS